eukprot:TRINITY_DN385_c0_g1_i2.p1 TRINITY_DN385_c0_g1~~TRINITY_DN385_c0_g1_i2.p1  ORF type:complete len:291 (-),score=62.41 TRINITY_DN385_c0_g1_i2:89-961(-)
MGQAQFKNFPYDIGLQKASYNHGGWALHDGVKKEDNSKVSIFISPTTELSQNYAKRLKTIRHPNIIKYIDTQEINNSVYLVTEHITPLEEDLPIGFGESGKHPDYYIWGIFQILQALSFLNLEHKLVHANISPSSIFVSDSGDWKLGSFDFLSEISPPSTPSSPSSSNPELLSLIKKHHESSIPSHLKPLELLQSNYPLILKSPSYSIDIFQLSLLIYFVFNSKFPPLPTPPSTTITLPGNSKIPKTLAPIFNTIFKTFSNPGNRPSPKSVLASEPFTRQTKAYRTALRD